MLKVHVKKSGNVAILFLQGRIVNGETAIVRNAMNSLTDASTVVLDLGRVNAIDAHGLGVMLQLREEAEAKGTEFRLVNVTQLVRRILEITRLDSVFEINPKPEILAGGCLVWPHQCGNLRAAPSA